MGPSTDPLFSGSEERSGQSPSMRDSSGLKEQRNAKGIFARSSFEQAARREVAKTRLDPRSGSWRIDSRV